VRRLTATTVYYGLELALSAPSYVFTAVFLVRDLHISPQQLILMGTVMETAVFAGEVPTSIVAEHVQPPRVDHRQPVRPGAAIALVGLAPSPTAAIVAWGIWGFGWTFMSGAWEAWITDEVGADNVGPVFLRGTRVSFVGAFLGLGLQGGVALYSLRAAVVSGGALTIACESPRSS
jgi:DHA3 family tetracycline resistance protein-like MFS transporter